MHMDPQATKVARHNLIQMEMEMGCQIVRTIAQLSGGKLVIMVVHFQLQHLFPQLKLLFHLQQLHILNMLIGVHSAIPPLIK